VKRNNTRKKIDKVLLLVLVVAIPLLMGQARCALPFLDR